MTTDDMMMMMTAMTTTTHRAVGKQLFNRAAKHGVDSVAALRVASRPGAAVGQREFGGVDLDSRRSATVRNVVAFCLDFFFAPTKCSNR